MKMKFNFAAPPHRRTAAPPHRRTAAPPHRRTKLALFLIVALLFNIVKGQSQASSSCLHVEANNPGFCMTSRIAFVLMIDEAFVAQYTDEEEARSKAFDLYITATTNLRDELFVKYGYLIGFSLVHFTSDIGESSWNIGDPNYLSHRISQYWKKPEKKCIKRHGVIYLTGLPFTGGVGVYVGTTYCKQGYRTGGNAIITNRPNDIAATSRTIAHEIMHGFGLGHIDNPETICAGECNSGGPLMCETSGSYRITGCDIKCLEKMHSQINCACLNDESVFEDVDETSQDPYYVCPSDPSISFLNYNPNPLQDCGSMDEITIDVTLTNGSSPEDRNVRLYLPNAFRDRLDLILESCQDDAGNEICFNKEEDFPGSRIEYRIVKNDGTEQFFALSAGESISVRAKFRYVYTGSYSLPHQYKFNLFAYTGQAPANLKVIEIKPVFVVDAQPSKTLTAVLSELSASVLPDWPLHIKGKLIVDLPSTDLSPVKYLLFDSGSELHILHGAKLHRVRMEGCDEMWKGIRLDEGTLDVDKATIKDAQNAITVRTLGKLIVKNSMFINNDVGIRPASGTEHSFDITLLSNVFFTSEMGLKSPFSGQTPVPSSRGYAGIYLNNASGVAMKKSSDGFNNIFDGLHNGIVAVNSNIAVKDAIFRNITPAPAPLSGYPTTASGMGVYAANSVVTVEGLGAAATATPSFEDCAMAVVATHSSLTMKNNRMENMGEGILFLLGTTNRLDINNNRIRASLRGISSMQPGVFSKSTSITNNIITMTGDDVGIGIQLALADSPKLPAQKALVQDNTVTMQDGHTGVRITAARGVDLFRNRVIVENPDTRNGIHTLGSHNLLVHCNTVYGDDASVNLRADDTWVSTWACNGSNDGGVGLNFSGECSGSDVRGNKITNIEEGMYYGLPGTGIGTVLVGTQEHRGNVFDNSGAVYAGEDFDIPQNRGSVIL